MNVSLCAACGFAFVDPRPTESALSSYYANQTLTYEHGPGSRQFAIETARHRLLSPLLAETALRESVPAICDIGCGHGDFLAQAGRPWNRVGLEANPIRAAFARAHYGLEIHELPVEQASHLRGQFDIVTILMVFEHVAEPGPFLRAALQLLKPGGLVCISVPNTLAPTIGLEEFFGFEHLNHFTPDVLRRFSQAEGLIERLMNIDANGLDGILYVGQLAPSAVQKPLAPTTPEATASLASVFTKYDQARRTLIQGVTRQLAAQQVIERLPELAIYGAGEHTDYLLQLFPGLRGVRFYIDRSPNLSGRSFHQGTIHSPDTLTQLPVRRVLISSHAFQEEIKSFLLSKFSSRFDILTLY